MLAEARSVAREPVSKVAAVIVAYGADTGALAPLLRSLKDQVAHTVLVVNPAPGHAVPLDAGELGLGESDLIQLPTNLGLPSAQNMGIERARQCGADAILFLDQDSMPEAGMLATLLNELNEQRARGEPLAGVGPVYTQPEGAPWTGFVTVGWTGFRRRNCGAPESSVLADFLISSGTLAPLDVLNQIGELDGSLFIDHADTEWCLRARHQGFVLRGVCEARMKHTLGDRRQRIWWFGQRMVSHHAPFRHYYMFRNSALLYRRRYIPLHWKCWDLYRSLRLMAFVLLASSNRLLSLRMMFRGWLDGLRGRSGPMPVVPRTRP